MGGTSVLHFLTHIQELIIPQTASKQSPGELWAFGTEASWVSTMKLNPQACLWLSGFQTWGGCEDPMSASPPSARRVSLTPSLISSHLPGPGLSLGQKPSPQQQLILVFSHANHSILGLSHPSSPPSLAPSVRPQIAGPCLRRALKQPQTGRGHRSPAQLVFKVL